MRYICDFHLHSKYSRATSPQMNLEDLDYWARLKGIQILGTGDFTHPEWLKELKTKLEPAETGLFKLKNSRNIRDDIRGKFESDVRFILTTEVSCIYTKNGVGRRIHLIIFLPDFQSVEKFNTQLSWSANLKVDGRPMLGLDAKEILKIALNISPECLVVPAHAWTPWYSIFGSKSGFNSLEECFDELTPQIYAIETGLSSSPAMNWRLSQLDRVAIISCSDSHSPKNLGREATVFEFSFAPTYKDIIGAIKDGSPHQRQSASHPRESALIYTIEFFPEEGKYHYDGHRLCNVCLTPEETIQRNNTCPVCGKSLTVGVMNRVNELADRPEGFKPEAAVPFKSVIPLQEIVAEALGVEKLSKKVEEEYLRIVQKAGSEFRILLDLNADELLKITSEKIADGIMRMRRGQVQKIPGYDGVYGKISVFSEKVEKKENKQGLLF